MRAGPGGLEVKHTAQAIEKRDLRRIYFSPRNFFPEEFRAIDFRELFELS